MSDVLVAVLLLVGLFFVLAGVVGIVRLPDFYARLHATSKCDTVGLALMVAAVAVHSRLPLMSFKLLLIIVFVALVNSTAAHAIGRAAYRSGLICWTRQESRS